VKVAAFQAPLAACASASGAIDLIREQVDRCESQDVRVLCCPEALLGGLADHAAQPTTIAIDVEAGELDRILAPLASARVATLVGFTELDRRRRLYNSAAVYDGRRVVGIYRKHHPAIRTSVYEPGDRAPVFSLGGLTFGIVICRDSVFAEPAAGLEARRWCFVRPTTGSHPTRGAPSSSTRPGPWTWPRRGDSACG
jgi:predicted amidohydrolase